MIKILYWNGPLAHSTRKLNLCGTGILPVVTHSTRKINLCGTGILPVVTYSTRKINLCGTGILPVTDLFEEALITF
ncbi:hypothetical protein QUA44_18170 [Microcoleus sp. N9_A2]|uniref:hypothetical protein n=1 Tax=unclassified Microcoleus TaxID=2642155 RepID=UPI002FCECEE3